MISVKKLNDVVVTPPKALIAQQDKRPVKGKALFAEPYANIFLCARKKSGKSIAIFNILKQCVGRDTTVIFFVSTFYKDKTYANMMKMLEDNHINYIGYTALKEDGVDHLTELVKMLTKKAEEDFYKKDEPKDKLTRILFSNNADDEDKPLKKTPYLAPDYIIVFDDLSDELKSPSLVALLKKNRQFLTKIIISSQYYLDILPSSRKQIEYFLIFKNITEDKLLQIHKDANLTITFEEFMKLYECATAEKFHFLYVDCVNSEFRKNFNMALEIK